MLDLAKVADVHPESNSVDLEFMADGRRIPGVQVMCNMAGTDFGAAGFGVPDAVGYGTPMTRTRDIMAVVGYSSGGTPIVLGFLYPQVAQCLFSDKNRMVWRSPSDVYFTVDGAGNAEVAHPSGAYVRIGSSTAHEDLTGKDYDKIWKIARNTGSAVHIFMAQAGGTATVDIAPDGTIAATSAVKIDFTAPEINLTGATTIDGEFTQETEDALIKKNLVVEGILTVGGMSVGGGTVTTLPKKTADFTLSDTENGAFVPMAAGTVATIPAGTLPVGYATMLMQSDVGEASVAGAPGVSVASSGGLTTSGQNTTMTLMQIGLDAWLISQGVSGNSGGSGGSGGGGSGSTGTGLSVLAGNNTGVIMFGGRNCTYSQVANTLTVSGRYHNLLSNFQTGMSVVINFIEGTAGAIEQAMGPYYSVFYKLGTDLQIVDTTTFTVTVPDDNTISGNLSPIFDPGNDNYFPLVTIAVPAGAIGLNGCIRPKAVFTSYDYGIGGAGALYFANNLFIKASIGGEDSTEFTRSQIQARNSNQKVSFGTLANVNEHHTYQNGQVLIDMTQSQNFVFGGRLSDPDQWICLEYAYLEIGLVP